MARKKQYITSSGKGGALIQVGFDLEGFTELNQLIQNAIIEAPKSTESVIHNYGEKGGKLAKEYAPWDTGYLHDQIESQPYPMASDIVSPASYSGFVNSGTRYMDAQPFFTDMWDEITEDIKEPLADVVKGVLRNAT